MRVRLLTSASDDLRRIADYIAVDNRQAAERLVSRIDARLTLIAETGFVGLTRSGRRPGTRELIEGNYIVTYRHNPARDALVVLSVIHGARRR